MTVAIEGLSVMRTWWRCWRPVVVDMEGVISTLLVSSDLTICGTVSSVSTVVACNIGGIVWAWTVI